MGLRQIASQRILRWSFVLSVGIAGGTALTCGILIWLCMPILEMPSPRAPFSKGNPPSPSNYHPIQVVPPMEPITDFPIRSVSEVGDLIPETDLILGVTVGQHSRAYPINMLTGPQREILNDRLGGTAIAATW